METPTSDAAASSQSRKGNAPASSVLAPADVARLSVQGDAHVRGGNDALGYAADVDGEEERWEAAMQNLREAEKIVGSLTEIMLGPNAAYVDVVDLRAAKSAAKTQERQNVGKRCHASAVTGALPRNP